MKVSNERTNVLFSIWYDGYFLVYWQLEDQIYCSKNNDLDFFYFKLGGQMIESLIC